MLVTGLSPGIEHLSRGAMHVAIWRTSITLTPVPCRLVEALRGGWLEASADRSQFAPSL